MGRYFKSMLMVIVAVAATPAAAADWYRAETEHFIVYSEDRKSATVDFVRELEQLDEVLRIFTGVSGDQKDLPPSSKVTVFRFGETRDLAALAVGNQNSGIGGFFIGRAKGSVAFVPRQRNKRRSRSIREAYDTSMSLDPKATLFHEYVHYFMFQHRDAPYPPWYSEGFAELFSNVVFRDDDFIIGEVPPWRSYSLTTIPVDLEAMFDPPIKPTRESLGRTYAHGWLLASHLNLNPERRGQLGKYMIAISKGVTPMEAARTAFGDLDVLRDELEEFRHGRARILKVPYAVADDPEVDIRRLTEPEMARMDLMIRSKRGVDADEAERLEREAEKLVGEYPNSPPVLLAATEAELDARDYSEAERLAQHVLALQPTSTNAAIDFADVALRRSFADPSQLMVARKRFAAANQMENDHAYPLYGYYLTYLFDDTQPVPEQAKPALERAFSYAPYDHDVRKALVHMLLKEDRVNEAKVVGASWTTGQDGYSCMVNKQFADFAEGERAPLLETMRPRPPGENLDKDAEKARSKEVEEQIRSYGCGRE